ncbi:MAG: ubiquinone biosynthesis regulatory protein kinase UbiB [Gammaproteobacteria bacterium]|nr:ubiquinone biosynthesis regulatory protein kinase UbiB [Gammaproteobacteria bacterium]
MFRFGELLRLLTIQRILIRHGMDEIILATHLFRPVRFMLYLLPWNWFRSRQDPAAVRLRRVLEDLGPVFVKLGQLLSTRKDFLSEDIAEEFAKLQDSVPPFPGSEARRIIEKEFGRDLDELFLEFKEAPLASASIAQVHSARLKNGRDVIIKVVRPGIEKIIRRDLGILHFLARQAENYSLDGRRLRPTNVVMEFEKTLMNELDLMREAANASQLRRNFRDSKILYIPQVEWDYTRRNVMVMERISGIPVSNNRALMEAGIDFKWLAESGVEAFFTMVFRDSFFHADMHPGNIFVSPSVGDKSPRIMLIDFGIMSSLSDYDLRYLAENFMAFLDKDYQRVAELHVESGWVPPETRVDEFEFAIRAVCEPLFDRPLKEISFGTLLLRLFQTARSFNMVIMPQLLLLQKTLVNIEGLGRHLYPDLNLWEAARPPMERWMNDRVGIKGLYKGTRQSLPRWLDRLPELPNKTLDIVERLRDGKIKLEWKSQEIENLRREIRTSSYRQIVAVIGSAFVISAAVIYGLDGYSPQMLWGAPVLSWFLGGVGTGMLILALND